MRLTSRILAAVVTTLALAVPTSLALADQEATPSKPGAKVYFQNIKDGDTISQEQLIKFGLSGMGVAPAGTEKEGTGHHHLLINAELTKEQIEQGIINDEKHRHFGGGQTEAVIKLKPGKYTLQLVLADHNHVPHKPIVSSDKISVTVK